MGRPYARELHRRDVGTGDGDREQRSAHSMHSLIRTVLRSLIGRNRKNIIARISSMSTTNIDLSLQTRQSMRRDWLGGMWTASHS
jgi:hypothetical protein